MSPELLEDEIVAQLQTVITTDVADIISLPQDDGSYQRPTGKAKLVVAYDNSEYKETLSTLPIQQPEWIEFVVTIQSRTIRGASGIYTMFGLIKEALIGFVPNDCEVPISGKWFGFPDVGVKGRTDDVWTYEFHLRTKSVLVEALDVDNSMQTVVAPTANPSLTANAQLILPNPLPPQGLLDDSNPPPIISIIEQ